MSEYHGNVQQLITTITFQKVEKMLQVFRLCARLVVAKFQNYFVLSSLQYILIKVFDEEWEKTHCSMADDPEISQLLFWRKFGANEKKA